jgi:hypothetical protein
MLALLHVLVVGVPFEPITWESITLHSHHGDHDHHDHESDDVPSAQEHEAQPEVRAELLVIVSDHGSGTSNFGDALGTHPCMFDLGEPFARSPGSLWSTNEIAECDEHDDPKSTHAIFDADTGSLKEKTNAQLTLKFEHALKSIPRNQRPANISDDASLYQGLDYNIAEYFVRIRDRLCQSVPEDVCPRSNCTITFKLFPQFMNADTGGQHTATDDGSSKCAQARNAKAMKSWTDALTSFKQNPKAALFYLERDELARQFSSFHRFTPAGTLFDCTIPRYPSAFANVSITYIANASGDAKTLGLGRIVHIEDCWKSTDGADTCLGDALKLVGLTTEPMGTAGEEEMKGKSIVHTTYSCSTDPHAIFKRLDNDDVEKVPASRVN